MTREKRRRPAFLVDKHVGTQLRMRRLMLGISQKELGEGIGVTFQQIQKYENGKNRISASRLQEFSIILRTPISSFFIGAPNAATGDEGIPAAVADFFATSEGLSLAMSFGKIKSLRVRRRILDLVESLVTRS